MQKTSFFILAMVIMVFIGLQTAEPTAAAKKPKLIDSGSQHFEVALYGTFFWKTYQYNKKYILIKTVFYNEDGTLDSTRKVSMKKISKYRIKMVNTKKYTNSDAESVKYTTATRISYIKTSLSVKQYYYKVIKVGDFNDEFTIFPIDD